MIELWLCEFFSLVILRFGFGINEMAFIGTTLRCGSIVDLYFISFTSRRQLLAMTIRSLVLIWVFVNRWTLKHLDAFIHFLSCLFTIVLKLL